MRVVVLEDERPALDELLAAIRSWSPDIEVLATHDSVSRAVAWFRDHPEPDLVFADVRLTDGRSLRVFEQVSLRCPVVFVTAYDQFAMQALEAGGIDYLLKPIDPRRVGRALDKVRALAAHFGRDRSLREPRRRVLVRHRGAVRPIDVDDIAWITTEHRLVVLVTRSGDRFLVDETLTALTDALDPARFFRTHRSWLVSAGAVQSFCTHGKGRLLLSLQPPTDAAAVVSAEVAPAFRAWLEGAGSR